MKFALLAVTLMFSLTGLAQTAPGPQSPVPISSFTLPDGRSIVTDTAGLSLYTFDVDNGSESKCYDACAKAWPPLLIVNGASLVAPLGTTQRTDGSTQITLDGKPLYYFVGDAAPGGINGDGLQGVWHLIVL